MQQQSIVRVRGKYTDRRTSFLGHSLSLEINREFRGNRLDNLALSDGEYWTHGRSKGRRSSSSAEILLSGVPYIYEQGRNVLFTFSSKSPPDWISSYLTEQIAERAEEQEGEEEQQQRKVLRIPVQPNPRLLSPLNEDATINDMYPAWSMNIASTLVPEHALVSVRSNRWPGLLFFQFS